MEVIIDGVRYVPATEAVGNIETVLRTLALQYNTPSGLEEDGFADLRILVSDGFEANEGETFDEFAARYAEEAARGR